MGEENCKIVGKVPTTPHLAREHTNLAERKENSKTGEKAPRSLAEKPDGRRNGSLQEKAERSKNGAGDLTGLTSPNKFDGCVEVGLLDSGLHQTNAVVMLNR